METRIQGRRIYNNFGIGGGTSPQSPDVFILAFKDMDNEIEHLFELDEEGRQSVIKTLSGGLTIARANEMPKGPINGG